jgi:ribonuclease E
VITVEMTPEEQEIYALMGVSPLVLAPEPVKDPKTTVVMVALPGQGRQGTNSTASGATSGIIPGATSGNGSGFSAALLEKDESAPTPDPILKSAAPVEPVAHAASLPAEAAIAPASPDPEDGDAAGDSSAPSRRRRRRRSSVSADESAS